MKLRLKLILAFLLLSVVPLAGVIVYSFVNSQRAVRKAVESEAQMMLDEMGRRLEGVRNYLSRQMDRLSQSPRFATIRVPPRHLMTPPFLLRRCRKQ